VATTKEAAMEWKRWEDNQKMAVIVPDQDSEMAKLIRKSRWNAKQEYDANHIKRALGRYCQDLPKEEQELLCGLGKRSRDCLNQVRYQFISRDKKIEMPENTHNHYCGDHSKCHHRAHQGYHSKNRDGLDIMSENRIPI
jgi:hypothetical protein